jgi:TolA-binding protein
MPAISAVGGAQPSTEAATVVMPSGFSTQVGGPSGIGAAPTMVVPGTAATRRDASQVLRQAARTPWMWGVGAGVVALAAVAAGLGAYFARGSSNTPATTEQTAAAAPAATGAPIETATATPPAVVEPSPATAAPIAKGAAPATTAPLNAPKPAGASTAAGALTAKPAPPPPAEKPPALAAASPTTPSRETQANQLLEVAKAKIANNLIDQGLTDLRQIIIDFPGSKTAVEAAFLAGEIHEKAGRTEDAMAAYLEFESRFGSDRRAADAKLRRAAMLGRQRPAAAQAKSLELLHDVATQYPGTPQAQLALQTKLRVETERKNLRAVDPVSKIDGPAYIATLRMIIDQFENTPQAMIARNRLSLAFVDLDRWHDAVTVLEEMAAKNENPNETYFRLAEIYERRIAALQ